MSDDSKVQLDAVLDRLQPFAQHVRCVSRREVVREDVSRVDSEHNVTIAEIIDSSLAMSRYSPC